MIQTPALDLKHSEREYFVSRIRAGIYTVKWNNLKLKVLQPNTEEELELNEIYTQAYDEAVNDGIKTEDQMVDWMIETGLWSKEQDDKIEQIKKDVDRLKKEIFNARLNHQLKETIRAYLRKAESAMSALKEKRALYYSNTCEGIATNEKIFAFLSKNTYFDNKPHDFSNGPSLDVIFNAYFSQILPEKTVRYLARNEPWRSIWILKDIGGINLFTNHGRELSIDQRNILVWSKMYDNVHESLDAPSDSVIEDDDMLDGWFIIQKEKSDKRKLENEIDGLIPKNKNADDVFLMANSKEDVDKIHSMNSTHARVVKQQRENLIKEQGVVNQIEFADEKLKITNMAKEQFKSNFRR